MFTIITSNFGFYLNLFIPLLIGIYLLKSNREYVLQELLGHVLISLVIIFSAFYLIFYFSTDLIDEEFRTDYVSSVEYVEEWKELVTYTESYPCGKSTCVRTKTRIDYHPEEYILVSRIGETYTTRQDYIAASREFGNKKVILNRLNQVSTGDGNKYVSTPNRYIPMTLSFDYVNYIKAAHYNILHSSTDVSHNVLDYPKEIRGEFSTKSIQRVISDTPININKFQKQLDVIAASMSLKYEVNPLIYVTAQDRSFVNSLRNKWQNGKKNDAILVLGITSGVITWSDSISLSDNTNFEVSCRNNFYDLNISDVSGITNEFKRIIHKNYTRKPMEDFEFLRENIDITWEWQLFVVFLNLVLSFFLYRYFTNN